jgi:hypothetical protein
MFDPPDGWVPPKEYEPLPEKGLSAGEFGLPCDDHEPGEGGIPYT